jgi:nitrogen fixation protein FixH
MNLFYIGLIIAAVLLFLFMTYSTYDANVVESSYRIAMEQNEDNYNSAVEWIGPKETTIFDDSILAEGVESAALIA